MHITGAKKIHYDSGPNMTPLVDVVMVILIFLMLCGSFTGGIHYIASNLPIGDGGDPTRIERLNDIQVDLRVDFSQAGGGWKARFGDVSTSNPKELRAALAQKLETFKSNGTPVDRLKLIINPSLTVKWEPVLQVYQSCLQAGYTKIGFSTAK